MAPATTDVTIERLVAGGDGLGREPSGRVVFVPGTLPGERVRVALTSERADFARGDVVEIVAASAARQSPPCPFVAAGCGGCGWQHVTPQTQVELKRQITKEALARTGGLAGAIVHAAPPLPSQGFRTTLRLAALPDGRLGFRARRSHDVVPVDHCLVAHPLIDSLLPARLPGAAEVTLRCGASTGERLALIEPAHVPPPAQWSAGVAVGSGAQIHEVIGGRRFRIGARSFFQTRADGAEALVHEVRVALGTDAVGARVVDAYAGVGLFAGMLPDAGSVVAIERSGAAVADARHNLPGVRVVHGDVARWKPQPSDIVIADPARDGLGRDAASVLTGCGAGRLVLVSCDPVTLARDAALLTRLGYDHTRTVLVDLFPHTPHIETVSRFDRR